MKSLEQSDFDKVESMLNSLVRKRKGKIIHLADSSKLTSDLASKLTVEEKEYYNNLHNISTDFTKQILGEKD
jgi:DNA replication factor GINS